MTMIQYSGTQTPARHSTDSHDSGQQGQLEKIEIQRRALEQLFKITRSVENLRVSLETTLLAGKSTGHTSEKAIALYQKLNAKTHTLSDQDIHMRLKRIDQKMKKHLSETIELVEHLDDEIFVASLGDALEITHNRIDDFKRSAQMMVALQVLLNVRGIPVAPKTFTISQKILFEKINAAKSRERQCRKQLANDTVVMEKDIQHLLASDACTEQMRPFMQSVLKGLKANRQHIQDGLNINELPYEIDQITMTDCAGEVSFDESNEASAVERSASEKSTPVAEIKKIEKIVKAKNKKTKPLESSRSNKRQKKKGLWARLLVWVNTPIETSIKDVFKK